MARVCRLTADVHIEHSALPSQKLPHEPTCRCKQSTPLTLAAHTVVAASTRCFSNFAAIEAFLHRQGPYMQLQLRPPDSFEQSVQWATNALTCASRIESEFVSPSI